jgi:hypothetical protein
MSAPKSTREANVTLRVDADVLTWARSRALFAGTSVNKLIRDFLSEHAAVPTAWREGYSPPWTPEGRIVQVMDPRGAGDRVAGRRGPEEQAELEASLSRQG